MVRHASTARPFIRQVEWLLELVEEIEVAKRRKGLAGRRDVLRLMTHFYEGVIWFWATYEEYNPKGEPNYLGPEIPPDTSESEGGSS